MADITLQRTHALGLKGARTAADKMAERLAEKFDLQASWSSNTLTFTRSGVNGTLQVTETHIDLEVTLGFMLKMMKGPIDKAIHENLDKALKEGAAKPAAKASEKPVSKAPAAKKPVAKKK